MAVSVFAAHTLAKKRLTLNTPPAQLDKCPVPQRRRDIIRTKKMGEALMWALKNGQIDDVRAALTPEDVNRTLPGGRTPLNVAADYGHTELVEFLITQGANVNAQDKHGMTPLLSATYEGHAPCVKILLEQGADKSCKGPDGLCAFEAAEKDDVKALLK